MTEVQAPGKTSNSTEKPSERRKKRGSGRRSRKQIAECLARLDAGESIEALALDYQVSTKVIHNWSNNRKKIANGPVLQSENSSGSTGVGQAPDSVKPIGEHEQGAEDGNLGKALQGAGFASGFGLGDGGPGATGSSGPIPGAPSPGASPPPSISPEQLLQFIKGIDLAVIGVVATAKAKHVPGEVLKETCAIPQETLDSMEIFAPYAADYAPAMLAYAKPAAAFLFVGVWGLSVATRFKALSLLEKEYAEKRQA
jgi:hypothetical protein